MSRFAATPASEELASFLQGLAPGAHVAVNLGALTMDIAVELSRQVAQARGERFIVIAHPEPGRSEIVADSLPDALPLETFVSTRGKAWVVVDAAASVTARSPREHAVAEGRLGVQIAPRLTVVCFYTEEALAKVERETVRRVHSLVASPGAV